MNGFKHTKLLAAIILASQSFQAHSLIYTLDISTDSTALFVNGASSNDFDSSTSLAFSVADVANGDTGAHTSSSGNSNGSFNMNSGAFSYLSTIQDTTAAYSTLTQSYVVTNDSAFEQLVDFTFHIENGSISASCGFMDEPFFEDGLNVPMPDIEGPVPDMSESSNCNTDEAAASAYEAEIFLNGDSIWNSSASIIHDEFGSVIDLSNDFLNGQALSSSYYWNAQTFTLDLGSFAAGESFTFDYVVSVASAVQMVTNSNLDAYAQFGDPNGFGSSNNGPFGTTQAVPEPASLLLMMAGVFGLGAVAKKRKKT